MGRIASRAGWIPAPADRRYPIRLVPRTGVPGDCCTRNLSYPCLGAGDVKPKGAFVVPEITETFLKNLAIEQGYSVRRAKQYARHIVTAPWFPVVVETYTMPTVITYADPTGEAAVHNVLTAALLRNVALETEAA